MPAKPSRRRKPSRERPVGPASGEERRGAPSRPWLFASCLAVLAAAFAVFLPALSYEFLNWDDSVYVLTNPWIRDVSWENLAAIFTRPYFQNYLPLHLVSYMADHAVWGLKPAGYHLTSVALHALNSLLCLPVVWRLTGSFPLALTSALFFAVQPSHVESVAWVSSRKDVLSAAFLLLSLLAYLRAWNGTRLRAIPYAASVVSFALALLSKMSVAPLPAFLLLLDLVPAGPRATRPRLLRALATKIPYLVIGFVLAVVNSGVQVKAQAPYAREPLLYLMVKGHAVWNYIGLMTGLRAGSPDYDLPVMGTDALAVVSNLGGLLILPALALVLLRWNRRTEFLGVSWIFLMLLPALLFPLVTYMADRYLYMPSLGFCWILAAGIAAAGNLGASPRWSLRTLAALAAAAAVFVGFAARTLQYSGIWKNSESLWTYAMTKSGDYRIYNNLADVRMTQKRWGEAERLLRIGARVENVTSYQSLGVLYYNLGRLDEALSATDRALAISARKAWSPSQAAELHFNRGAIFWLKGSPDSAVSEWNAALRIDPNHAQAREWIATAERRRGR